MATRVRFPKVGANVIEGAVGVWHKAEGDAVSVGDPLVEIVTSKATFDVESPIEGVLRSILAPAKSVLPVGYILCVVGSIGEDLPDAAVENERLLAEFRASARTAAAAASGAKRKVRATPGARRLAGELGVDLASVVPSGGGGVIREADVRRVAAD